MGRKVFFGLIAIAGAIGLFRYGACAKPETRVKPFGGDASTNVNSGSESTKTNIDELPRPTDPAVATAVDELLAAWDKTPAIVAEVKTDIPEVAGNKGKTTGTGTYKLQKDSGKILINFELRNSLEIPQDGGVTLLSAEYLLRIIDGKYLYMFTNQPGHMEATKKKLDYGEVLLIGGRELFRDLIARNTLSLLPEEMLEGRATRVILAIPKDGTWKTRHWFDKATGVRLKMEETDAHGQDTLLVELSGLDVSSSFAPETFVFTVPEGVKFVDETAQTP